MGVKPEPPAIMINLGATYRLKYTVSCNNYAQRSPHSYLNFPFGPLIMTC